ncbi:MAG TPA: hypothetical protein K8V05_07185 [Butyricimonas virosa]|uniref:Lipoprotein n=1 Tax=Butyricimonas virosa TaxID=544645 RepID=A0A921H4Q1_9BACT|nr:hypothetical protein [Butyricimonas virosa]
MKTFKSLCVIVLSAITLASCGLGSDLTSNKNSLQTNVVLTQNNYKIVKTITGEATATYILGIGGLSSKALKENAVANMVKEAKLDGRCQAIVNTQVSVKNAIVTPFYVKKIVTATAQVIEFTK